MDTKLLMGIRSEGIARKRRSHGAATQQQQQQQQQQLLLKAARQERTGGNIRSKSSAKLTSKQIQAQTKYRSNAGTVAVVPPSRQWHNGNSNNNNNKHNRFTFAKEQKQRPEQRSLLPPVTSRVAFGSTCNTSLTQVAVAPLTRRGSQKRLKPLAAAHEQLELLLTRIEQGSDAATAATTIKPAATTTTPTARRRKPPPARSVRRQMEHPPPVPTATPLDSARYKDTAAIAPNYDQLQILDVRTGQFISYAESQGRSKTPTTTTTTATRTEEAGTTATAATVPLTLNPQSLAPEKRLALLELLSRAEQNDQQIISILRSEVNDAGDPSRDAMRLTLQMLPLALKPGESPYCEQFWAGHRYLKERQKLQQQLQANDMRYKEVQILRGPNGNFFLSKTLEEQLKDEKHVLDFVEAELQRGQLPAMSPEQQLRQQRAMDERVELDRSKQQVSEWRARRQLEARHPARKHVFKRKVKKRKQKQLQLHSTDTEQEQLQLQATDAEQEHLQLQATDAEQEHLPLETKQDDKTDNISYECLDNDSDSYSEDDDITPRPSIIVDSSEQYDNLSDSLMQRQQFQEQCQRSSLYNNNADCLAPWKLFANITNTLSAELTENIDVELHRSIAGYINDFVDNETRLAKRFN